MIKTLVSAAAASIAIAGTAPHVHAADAAWVAWATVEKGSVQNCGSGQSDWQVAIKGNSLTYSSVAANRSYTVDLKSLQPDGSGKATAKDEKNREFYVTFETGPGPRVFRVTSSLTACGYLFTPKK